MSTPTGYGPFEHGEAFRLMHYQTDDKRDEEIIWNSRDGVTPFMVHHRDGRIMSHVRWSEDVLAPGHVPQPGERVFVTMTPDFAAELAARNVARWWDDPTMRMHKRFESRDIAIGTFAATYMQDAGAPTIRVVADEGWPNTRVSEIES